MGGGQRGRQPRVLHAHLEREGAACLVIQPAHLPRQVAKAQAKAVVQHHGQDTMPPAATILVELPATTMATIREITTADAQGSAGSTFATSFLRNSRARRPATTGSSTVLTMSPTMAPASICRYEPARNSTSSG